MEGRGRKADILIRCKDGQDHTQRCLHSIFENTPRGDFRLILSDDGSGLPQPLSGECDIYLKHRSAHGAVTATNLGLATSMTFADTPYVVVMDNDTAVPDGDDGWLDRFIAEIEEYPDTACVGATTNYANPPQHILAVPQTYTADWGDEERGGQKENPQAAWFVSFCCLLRKAAVRQCGLWDERYNPGNYEDTDYAVQLRESGFSVRVARSVYIHHKGHATFSEDLKRLLQVNRVKFLEKWGVGRLYDLGLSHPQEVAELVKATENVQPQ